MAISVQQAEIESLYVGYFGRSSNPRGWPTGSADSMTACRSSAIAQSFSVQPEATDLYPFLANPTTGGAAGLPERGLQQRLQSRDRCRGPGLLDGELDSRRVRGPQSSWT